MPDVSRIRAQLGKELRAARTLAGLSQRALHAKLGGHPSQVTLSRVENGTTVPDRDLVKRWLRACSADADVRDRVAAQLDAAHNETRAWADMLGDEAHLQGVARIRDEDARLVRNCQVCWIPGLLQTSEYALALIPLIDPRNRFDHVSMLTDRMHRQEILYGQGRTFEFLIAEAALLWQPAGGVMPAQLDRLVELAALPTVRVGILPSRRVGAVQWHSFIYREAAQDGRTSVTTELVHGGGSVIDPEMVNLYQSLWADMWDAAVVEEDAHDLIRGLA